MVSLQVEIFSNILFELKPLLEKNIDETGFFAEDIDTAIDFDKYIYLDTMGALNVITAREDGILVGYCIDTVFEHPHFKGNIFATNEVFYVSENHRGLYIGQKMLDHGVVVLKEKGVKVWLISVSDKVNISTLLNRKGFRDVSQQLGKVLR